MPDYPVTDRSRLGRAPMRAHYDHETVHAVLDASPVCHVAYVVDGQPYATPTTHWRKGTALYWHGSAASRMIQAVDGAPVCVTVSTLDGFVLARAPIHHSVNFRSVMAFGTPRRIDDAEAKEAALKDMMEYLFPGRWDEVRENYAQESKGTTVVRMEIEEASAKIRTGPPVDDEEDYALGCWAGVLPVETFYGEPQSDPRLNPGTETPSYDLRFWKKRR